MSKETTNTQNINKVTGITFNNRTTHDLGVGWKTASRPTSPKKKESTFSPSAFDGEYDFSTYNPDNRPHYEVSEISGQILINTPDIRQTQSKVREVMQWLHSNYGKPADFIFDDTPDRIYKATFLDSSAITNYELYKSVTITVTFKVDPFPRSEVRRYSQYVSGNSYIALPSGSFYTKPKITLTGDFNNLKVIDSQTGRQLVYKGVSSTGNTTILDFETESVVKDGQYFNEYLFGDFWELRPFSTNNIQIEVIGYANVDIEYPVLEVY